jgi:ADP-heptose:LPS heptosyltransferase
MKILFVTGGGIGNIIQSTPCIKAIAAEGHIVDLKLYCNTSTDIDLTELFSIPHVRHVFIDQQPKEHYDYELRGLFIPGKVHNAKSRIKSRIHYAQHIPESEVYYDLAKQLGIKTPMEDCEVFIGEDGPKPHHSDTIAIYPGSKHNWAMKRWDKYDELTKCFKHVAVVGTSEDINSHGNPTWITKPWNWPKNVTFIQDTIQHVAHFIAHCKFFVGNDGGLAHVSAATGIPTFILFGPSSDVKNKPKSKNSHVIAIQLPCRPCQFKEKNGKQIFDSDIGTCYMNMKCMRDMTVDFVYNEINKKIT